jgi:addiction module RelE/StbE family toxin
MKLDFHPHFVRSLRKIVKRNPELNKIIKDKIKLFQENPRHSSLKLHKLTAKNVEQWSIKINPNLRIIIQYSEDTAILVNIGSHDEVY